MAQDLYTLIRLNEWTVDERRRELADVLNSLASLEDGLERLQKEVVKEQEFVKNSPEEAGFFYGNYAGTSFYKWFCDCACSWAYFNNQISTFGVKFGHCSGSNV